LNPESHNRDVEVVISLDHVGHPFVASYNEEVCVEEAESCV
jgi:hypothetical protein